MCVFICAYVSDNIFAFECTATGSFELVYTFDKLRCRRWVPPNGCTNVDNNEQLFGMCGKYPHSSSLCIKMV